MPRVRPHQDVGSPLREPIFGRLDTHVLHRVGVDLGADKALDQVQDPLVRQAVEHRCILGKQRLDDRRRFQHAFDQQVAVTLESAELSGTQTLLPGPRDRTRSLPGPKTVSSGRTLCAGSHGLRRHGATVPTGPRMRASRRCVCFDFHRLPCHGVTMQPPTGNHTTPRLLPYGAQRVDTAMPACRIEPWHRW